jgi:hypothetical protein
MGRNRNGNLKYLLKIERAKSYVGRKRGSHIWKVVGTPGVGSGKGCRYHGAHKPNMVKRGAYHPRYRHGGETLEAKVGRHEMAVLFREAESLMSRLGMLALGSARTRGRKPVS